MPQEDGHNELKRMAFSYNGRTVNLWPNPQNYQFQEPQRATTIKTQGDNVIEQYGPDFPIISISGHTGYKIDANGKNGKQRLEDLKSLILSYQSATIDGLAPDKDLTFYNYTDDQSYVVTIPTGGFEYSRSVDTAVLFNYSISMAVLRGSDQPDRSSVINALVGSGSGQSTQNPKGHLVTNSSTQSADVSNAVSNIEGQIGG